MNDFQATFQVKCTIFEKPILLAWMAKRAAKSTIIIQAIELM